MVGAFFMPEEICAFFMHIFTEGGPDRTRLSLEFKKQANKINIEKQKRIIS